MMMSNKTYNIILKCYAYLLKPVIIAFGSLILCMLFSWGNLLPLKPLNDVSINFSINTLIISEIFSCIDSFIKGHTSSVFVRLSNSKTRFKLIRSSESIDTESLNVHNDDLHHIFMLIKVRGILYSKRSDTLKVKFPKFVKAISDEAISHKKYVNDNNVLYFKLPETGVTSADILVSPNVQNSEAPYNDGDAESILDLSTYKSFFIRPSHLGKINLDIIK